MTFSPAGRFVGMTTGWPFSSAVRASSTHLPNSSEPVFQRWGNPRTACAPCAFNTSQRAASLFASFDVLPVYILPLQGIEWVILEEEDGKKLVDRGFCGF